MSKVDEKNVAIARVYSRAMLEVAEARNQAEELLSELGWLADYQATNSAFATFVTSPLVDGERRADSLERMFRGRLSDLAVDSLQVINRKGRLGLLATIAETYRQLLRDRRRRIDVYVRTASPIDDDVRGRIHQVVSRAFGKDPDLHEEIDASLIGGIVLQVEDDKADASVSNRIRQFRQVLAERAAEEIYRSRQAAEE